MVHEPSKSSSLSPYTFNEAYKGKRVLITGHTGFKGSWLAIWLRELGAEITGYALDPKTTKDNFVISKLNNKINSITGDVRNYDQLLQTFKSVKPEIIFHLAAQSLVKQSYKEPLETLQTNIMGTSNILEAIRNTDSARVAVLITSDKCYENNESVNGYKESDTLGGYDTYSASKGCCEIIISAYRNSFFNPIHHQNHKKSIASARAGNVIGGGDWAKDRIVPDCIRYLENMQTIPIRNPHAVRPWQHVLEPLSGYLLLGQKMLEKPTDFCEAWNFGPSKESLITVSELADKLIKNYGTGSWTNIDQTRNEHETDYLALDCNKAKKYLRWVPRLNIDETIKLTSEWYINYKNNDDCYSLAKQQITYYTSKMDKPVLREVN